MLTAYSFHRRYRFFNSTRPPAAHSVHSLITPPSISPITSATRTRVQIHSARTPSFYRAASSTTSLPLPTQRRQHVHQAYLAIAAMAILWCIVLPLLYTERGHHLMGWTFNVELSRHVGQQCMGGTLGDPKEREVLGHGKCKTWPKEDGFSSFEMEWSPNTIIDAEDPAEYGDCTLHLYSDSECTVSSKMITHVSRINHDVSLRVSS